MKRMLDPVMSGEFDRSLRLNLSALRWSPCARMLVLVSAGALCSSSSAQDWPQWRGPARTGVSAETNWSSKGAEAPLWTRSVGLGYSSVVVSGDRLYTALDLNQLRVPPSRGREQLWRMLRDRAGFVQAAA